MLSTNQLCAQKRKEDSGAAGEEPSQEAGEKACPPEMLPEEERDSSDAGGHPTACTLCNMVFHGSFGMKM